MVHFMENSNFFWAIKFLLSSTALPNVLKDSNSWKEKMAVVLRTGGTACDSEPPCEPGAERGDHGPLGSEDPASSPRALGPPSRLRAVGALAPRLTPAAPRTRGQTLRAGAAASASCGRLPSSNGRGPQHTGDDVSSRALETTDPKGTQRARPSFGEGAASPRSNRARRLSAGVLSAFDLETADLVIPRFHQELEGGVWEGEMCLTASARQQGSEIISGKKIRYPDWSFPFSVFTK